MTNKQDALKALRELRPMTGNDTPNEYWFEIAAVISKHMDTIRAALTEALKPFIIDKDGNISEATPNADTITLTRAEFEAVKDALKRSLDCGYSDYDKDQALAILSKHGETK